jgi:hypothetical protein
VPCRLTRPPYSGQRRWTSNCLGSLDKIYLDAMELEISGGRCGESNAAGGARKGCMVMGGTIMHLNLPRQWATHGTPWWFECLPSSFFVVTHTSLAFCAESCRELRRTGSPTSPLPASPTLSEHPLHTVYAPLCDSTPLHRVASAARRPLATLATIASVAACTELHLQPVAPSQPSPLSCL